MKTIYRYEINNSNGVNKIKMPTGANILNVGFSGNNQSGTEQELSLWALIDTNDNLSERTFIVAGTGANLDEVLTYNAKYIGTVCKKNMYAFHVFEVNDNINIF